ncbi:MAG: HAMP domain-containing histidine kinase [Bacteroidetes bacterium]|jgi:signal transduction histidine kinase|nr:HAMP domain-containing histidine kinase [Bacteroidota bacterium]MBT6686466.1 HAMP domain-containing histidine kinase [Bacteroidota bacterium]MBT7143573.1 HAMP domain-containing histidine kinase [Bacteroidota bacterium]MBT7491371.1 HAMP domain-containing histidine kinase [Bacteroidota bacterium]
MNIYSKRQKWKLILFVVAVVIGVSSLWYTNILIKKLAVEERKKVELWASATKLFPNISNDEVFTFISEVIINNVTIPVILTEIDDAGNETINYTRNLDTLRLHGENYLQNQLEIMKSMNEPIEIELYDGQKNYIYYKDSILLTQLFYYPYIQLLVIMLFILVSYFAFNSTRKAEQNQVWVGMSKETAHQLGTPISSLLAWLEFLKLKNSDAELLSEVEKDIKRLETITERFSKIGSTPVLKKANIADVLNNSITYLKTRSSKKIKYILNFSSEDEIFVSINIALFEWVIENICKNAMDAMEGDGTIDITVTDNTQVIYLDIKDTGKGIPKSKYKTIFHPGFTTKQRGWGLGLSLTKRIVEIYHSGKIFVKNSELNRETTFRIVLKK